jgi:hypothetical protein
MKEEVVPDVGRLTSNLHLGKILHFNMHIRYHQGKYIGENILLSCIHDFLGIYTMIWMVGAAPTPPKC